MQTSELTSLTSEQQRAVDFIKTPEKWPHMVLPVINTGTRDTAFITEGGMGEITLWFGNLWNIAGSMANSDNRVVFKDAETLVRHGWLVD